MKFGIVSKCLPPAHKIFSKGGGGSFLTKGGYLRNGDNWLEKELDNFFSAPMHSLNTELNQKPGEIERI